MISGIKSVLLHRPIGILLTLTSVAILLTSTTRAYARDRRKMLWNDEFSLLKNSRNEFTNELFEDENADDQLSSFFHSRRFKRQAVAADTTTVSDYQLSGWHTVNVNSANLGNTFTVEARIILPNDSLATSHPNLTVQVYGYSSLTLSATNRTKFSVCDASVTSVGSGVTPSVPLLPSPTAVQALSVQYPLYAHVQDLALGEPFGTNANASYNSIDVRALATFIDRNETDGSEVAAYIGFDYGDDEGALIRNSFSAVVSSRVDATTAKSKVVVDPLSTQFAPNGSYATATFFVYTTRPYSNLSIKAVATPDPATATDVFNVANVHLRNMGSGFGCMADDGGDGLPYPMTLYPSSTTKTMLEARKDFGPVYSLADVGEPETDPKYLLIIDVVVGIAGTALDGQKVKVKPFISFYGDPANGGDVTPVEHVITVQSTATPLSNAKGANSTHVAANSYVYISGQNTTTGVFQQGPGGIVPFRVMLNLRGVDFVDYHLRVTNNLTSASICIARLVRRGYTIPWTEPLETDVNVFYSADRRVMDVQWGRIRNTGQIDNDTAATVELEVVTSVPLDAVDKTQLRLEFAFIVGSVEIPVNETYILITNNTMVSSAAPNFTLRRAWDPPYWHTLGAVSVDLQVSLPPGAPLSNLTVDIGSDANAPTRVCRAELSFAGFSLPCALGFAQEINEGVTYYKSNPATLVENNRAVITLGSICADILVPKNDTENDVILNIVLEQPYGLDGIVNRPANVLTSPLVTNVIGTRVQASKGVSTTLSDLYVGSLSVSMSASPTNASLNATGAVVPTMRVSMTPASPAPGASAALVVEIQTPPQSVLSLKLTISSGDLGLCRAVVVSAGHSIPCLMPFSDIYADGRNLSWTMNSWAWYREVAADGTHAATELNFPRLTNVGREPMGSSTSPTEINTFQVMQTIQVGSAAKTGTTKSISVNFTSMDESVVYASTAWPVTVGSPAAQPAPPEANIQMNTDAEQNNSTTVSPGVMHILYVTIVTHEQMLKGLKLVSSVSPADAASVCSAQVVDVGLKIPCLNASVLTSSNSRTNPSTQLLPDSVTLNLGTVCNQQLPIPESSTTTKESLIRVAVSIVPNKNAAAGSTFTITHSLTVTSGATSGVITRTQRMTVAATPVSPVLSTNTSVVVLSTVANAGLPPPSVLVTESAWVPFNVSIPPGQIFDVTLNFSGFGQDGRAAVLITGVRITRRGRNLLCCGAGDWNTSVTYTQMSNPLQKDSLALKLGFVRNPGFSYLRGDNMDEDDIFTVEVQVEPTDHPVCNHGKLLPITLQVDINGVKNASMATQPIRVLRTGFEYMSVSVRAKNPNASVPFPRFTEVPLKITFQHSQLSTVEPLAVTVRYFLPKSVKYANNFITTSQSPPRVTQDDDLLVFEFGALLLGDVVSLEVKLLVDPNNVRGYGSGNGEVIVPYEAYAKPVRRFGLPLLDDGVTPENGVDVIPLTSLKTFKFYLYNEDCYFPIGLSNATEFPSCQFTASSYLDASTIPSKAGDFASSGWQAEIREGKFVHWLAIDLGKIRRVTRLKLGLPNGVHKPKAITVEHSFTGTSWESPKYGTFAFAENEVWPAVRTLTKPFKARMIRLRVVSTWEGTRIGRKIGLHVEAYGCEVPAVIRMPANMTNCQLLASPRASFDPLQNRHFVVDTLQDRAFYCDLSVKNQEMRCFASSPGVNEWRLLPFSLTSVRGFQPSTGRTFFMDEFQRAIVHTVDGGQTFAPTGWAEFAAIEKLSEFRKSTLVPAKASGDVLAVASGNWAADYVGIKYHTNYFVKWTACCSN